MCQALKEIRKEAFVYANIEANDEKPAITLAYSVFTALFDMLKPFILVYHLSHKLKRPQLEINFMPH